MAVNKRRFRNKSGKMIVTNDYYVIFSDHTGQLRTVRGCTNKKATQELENKLLTLASLRTAGMEPDAAMQKWLDSLSSKLIDNLAKWGLIKQIRLHAKASMEKHIEDYGQYLKDKGCCNGYINTIVPRIEKGVEARGFTSISDLNVESVRRFVADLALADETKKHYIKAFKQFSKWLRDTNRAGSDILKDLHPNNNITKERPRRALSREEVARLLKTALNSPKMYRDLTGYDRYMIYRFALETGLRANEVRTLEVADFDFKDQSFSIKPENEKSRRGATLPMKPELSRLVEDYSQGKHPKTRVFMVTEDPAEIMRTDLEDAEIEYQTYKGFADFHALRHTFATNLAKSGVNIQTAQKLMRHADINLTLKIYTHLETEDLRSGLNNVPELSIGSERTASAG
ncbi:MAG: tyrosine-type recombinase/integrase [Phycisphaerae bacterium]